MFDDLQNSNVQHTINVGDYNEAPVHNMDTAGYLHINNPVSRQYIRSRMMTNELTDIWQDSHPTTRSFTFDKLQKKIRTKARLDHYIISKNSVEILYEFYIDRTSNLSDHRPIPLNISSSPLKRGRGFWWFYNSLLKDAEFIDS